MVTLNKILDKLDSIFISDFIPINTLVNNRNLIISLYQSGQTPTKYEKDIIYRFCLYCSREDIIKNAMENYFDKILGVEHISKFNDWLLLHICSGIHIYNNFFSPKSIEINYNSFFAQLTLDNSYNNDMQNDMEIIEDIVYNYLLDINLLSSNGEIAIQETDSGLDAFSIARVIDSTTNNLINYYSNSEIQSSFKKHANIIIVVFDRKVNLSNKNNKDILYQKIIQQINKNKSINNRIKYLPII